MIILLCYLLFPFIASIPGLIAGLLGASAAVAVIVPVSAAGLFLLFRKKLDLAVAAKINGLIFLVLLICFTGMMFIASGNVEGIFMSYFNWLIIPYAPVILICLLMGQNILLYLTVFLSYGASFLVCLCLSGKWSKKLFAALAIVAVCIACDTYLYRNRPSVKYGGHGFEFMHGYSSTDFSDYMVYSPNTKLVLLDTVPSFVIENEEDMPVLDGAEACYPLYAAFAKAIYKDIDRIEMQWLQESDRQYCNGKIVTFTNSVMGFKRLLLGAEENSYDDSVDMFFGARPSAEQLQEAEEKGVELEITPIAKEAFVFFVEADNPVDNLTSDQIKAIYHGDITNWKEVGGKDQEILAFQRPQNSGSQTMMQYFMGDISLKDPQTYETVDAMTGVIRRVAQYANEKGAVGYSFRYFLEELNQETGVKMLSVNGVYPSSENIENGSYPLVTNVCLITRKDDTNPYIQKMKEFILSEQGQYIIKQTGYAGIS